MTRTTVRDRRMLTTYAAATLLTVLSLTHVTLAQEADPNMAAPQAVPAAEGTLPPPTEDKPTPPTSTYGWQDPLIAPSTTKTTFPNRPLLITGAVLLGGSYAASAVVAGASGSNANEKLYYPVVGPWMDLDYRNCGLHSCSGTKTGYQVLLIADGVAQGAGALLVVMSLFIPEQTTRNWYLLGNNSLRITPQLGGVAGVSALGAF